VCLLRKLLLLVLLLGGFAYRSSSSWRRLVSLQC
jgi:hypothetical protein